MTNIRNWLLGEDGRKKSGLKRSKIESVDDLNNDKTKKRVILSDDEEFELVNKKENIKKNVKKQDIQSVEEPCLVPINVSQFFMDKNKILRSSPASKKVVSDEAVQESYINDDDFSFSQSDLLEFEELDKIYKDEINQNSPPKTVDFGNRNDICNIESSLIKKDPIDLKGECTDTSLPVIKDTFSNIKTKESVIISKKKNDTKVKITPKKKSNYTNLITDKQEQNVEDAKNIAQKVLNECPLISLSDLENVESKGVEFYDHTTHVPLVTNASKEIPIGRINCLSGLTFVFTGILKTIDREEGCNLVKRYGGKVTTAPSSKTSFVVLGTDAGPKKIEVIKKNKLKTINEDGLFYLIKNMPALGGDTKAAQLVQKKREEQNLEAEKMAKLLAPETREMQKIQSCQLWTTKYAPQSLKEICGNKSLVEKLQRWLRDWDQNRIANFKKPGSDGLGFYRAVLISGPPGIGKTTSAHLVAKLEGYDVLEFNASDTRNKKLLEDSLIRIYNNTSLSGFFSTYEEAGKKNKLVLIMDEVDGISTGDYGGIGELNSFIKKTLIPIICICNDRASRKLLPLDRTTFDLKFRRPDVNSLRSRIMSIAYRENLKLEPQAIDQLAEITNGDIRQIINILSSWKITQTFMSIDDGKNAAKAAEKHIIMNPWDIVGKFLSGGIFRHTSKLTLSDKIELYFNDHELSHLMFQENYLKTRPDLLSSITNLKQKNHEHLKLIEKASESISYSDIVDSMIHGPQQHWGLMPMHAVFSCVIPSFYVSGFSTSQYSFTSLLGNLSKTNKLMRYLQSIQAHMSSKITGNCSEVRKFYIPLLFDLLLRRLEIKGQDIIPDIIKLMDEYFLSKEHSEYILELSLGPNNGNLLKIPTQTKASFTKQYNKTIHPIPFCDTFDSVKPGIVYNTPDIEDALETNSYESQERVSDNEDGPEKDKLVIESGKKGKRSSKGTAKKKKNNNFDKN
ncbi:hypothetical protein PNEG_02685 [Pneumocystis murina B123]|uniref:Replication factor C subunit 1 n=1 Tax=Pneumocystis murina (strain B123) TaxID=1069680 RepID=M7NJV5_PNEMU|nr:hypothetical protein PNEG_02685 [Pneumocystis murina B123]EMR08903.1 hypothetical protein PNEG_02685 [Pneumocystis murina B123]